MEESGEGGRVVASATLHLGQGRGFTLPTWFLSIITACAIGASATVAGVAVTTWADVRDNTKAISTQEARIERLEESSTDIAVVKAQLADVNAKLDWLMNQQGQRGRGTR